MPGDEIMTHAELVSRAKRWLANTQRCAIVMSECGAYHSRSIPDAIGWKPTWRNPQCIMVECKVSVQDFRADRHKPSHRGGQILGTLRYYMTPLGLLVPEQIPDPWGLVECEPKRVRVVKRAVQCDSDRATEINILLAEMRRVANGWRKHWQNNGLYHAEPVSEDES